MKENKLRAMLNNGLPTLGTRVWSTWPFITEAVGSSGIYDYIEFVAEYSPYAQPDLENIVRAAELHGMGTMIKVDFQNRGYVAQKALASGFQSILFIDHKTPEEVRETIHMISADVKSNGRFGYPCRRWIGYQPFCTPTQHIDRLNDIVIAFMIEKQEAIDNIEEICSIPGVDMVQFGPFDFSMNNGKNPNEYEQEVNAAEKKMIEAALKYGVHPRCEIYGPASSAQRYIDMGVKHFCFGDEIINGIVPWVNSGKEMRKMTDNI
ncbi:MAG: HpcH/HpaI aldolase family protein [Christensenellales bacterium]